MLPLVFALLCSFCFACASIFGQKGLHLAPAPWGAWITVLVNGLFLWAVHLLLHPEAPIFIAGNLPYVVIGLFVPGITRMLSFRGIRTMGSSVNSTVLNSTPLFSTTLAIVFLGERPGLLVLSGISSIVSGLMTLSWGGGKRSWSRVELLYPLLACFFFGVKDVIARWGMAVTGQPILAAAIAAATASVEVFLIIRYIQAVRFSLPFSKASLWFVVSGLFTGGSFLFMFLALYMERVIIVSPVVSSYSVFVLLLSPIIARRIETVTLRKTVGAVVVVTGVFLIAIGRN